MEATLCSFIFVLVPPLLTTFLLLFSAPTELSYTLLGLLYCWFHCLSILGWLIKGHHSFGCQASRVANLGSGTAQSCFWWQLVVSCWWVVGFRGCSHAMFVDVGGGAGGWVEVGRGSLKTQPPYGWWYNSHYQRREKMVITIMWRQAQYNKVLVNQKVMMLNEYDYLLLLVNCGSCSPSVFHYLIALSVRDRITSQQQFRFFGPQTNKIMPIMHKINLLC